MPPHGHHGGHHAGPPLGYACPICGYPHPTAYGPAWHPYAGRRYGLGYPPPWPAGAPAYPPPWAPPWPGYAPPAPPRPATDEELRTAISGALRADPRIPPQAQISVDVREGVVTLTGSVPDKWTKQIAGQIALSLPGVVDVENQLQVPRPGTTGREGGAA
ncbi:MAG TPA: BON domain-containing protein [Chloroflexota bacterium]